MERCLREDLQELNEFPPNQIVTTIVSFANVAGYLFECYSLQ